HEYKLLTERLKGPKYEDRSLFAFANTVTTLNFSKTNDPHGWIGIRFQVEPGGEPNDIIFHIRLLDSDSSLQQSVLGILGVNLVYASFYYRNDPQVMIESLVDNLSPGSVEIDLVKVNGSIFKDANERLLIIYLVAKYFSSAYIMHPQGHVVQAKELLNKKYIIILCTKNRQKTNPNSDLIHVAAEEFKKNSKTKESNLVVMIEVFMSNAQED